MPSRNILKVYVENGVYHIYNRGVEKRDIFMDERDYKTFLCFLKEYLLPEDDEARQVFDCKGRTFAIRSFAGKIELLAYCLMPNHFHLLVRQKERSDITEFMKCLITRYSIYFNQRYERVGTLFQGRYKGVLVQNDEYIMHLSRYIHLNPLQRSVLCKEGVEVLQELSRYTFSSYLDYIGQRKTKWVAPEFVLGYFSQPQTKSMLEHSEYQDFVENYKIDAGETIEGMTLE